jgi:hypothetical protein
MNVSKILRFNNLNIRGRYREIVYKRKIKCDTANNIKRLNSIKNDEIKKLRKDLKRWNKQWSEHL